MKITIDHARCTGHGRCYSLAPEVFNPDEEGFVSLDVEKIVGDRTLAEQAAFGAASCPEGAIRVAEI